MAKEIEHFVTSPAITDGGTARVRDLPSDSDIALMELGLIAKSVCSGLYVSERELADITQNSVRAELSNGAVVALDTERPGQVTAHAGELSRTAIDTGGLGCVLLPIGAREVFFDAGRAPPVAAAVFLDARSSSAFAHAADAAFQHAPDTGTAAVAIWHQGAIVAERYGAGVSADTRLESWSMGKSAVALLIACAAADGLLNLGEPIALSEWKNRDDPRRMITFEDALRMSSGIDFSAPWAEDYRADRDGYPDHSFIYSGAIDIRALAASRGQRHTPGQFGAYKNGDTLLLLAGLEDRLKAIGKDLLHWGNQRLFAPAGAGGLVFETDAYGHVFGTGNV
ncbi:MAG: serine hydrolase domain-containing protein, partial [Pseudomonadota bacterium]